MTEMQSLNAQQHWRDVFDRYDLNHDGKINLGELRNIIEGHEYKDDIPDHTVKAIFEKADQNLDGNLDFYEFIEMIMQKENHFAFSHLKERYIQYVHFMMPPKEANIPTVVDGAYEDEYSCWPPRVIMILISLVEIVLFCVDAITGYDSVGFHLIYNPRRRKECWRFISYMFVHVGWFHLIVNIFVQIMLGTPLEMVHKGGRVLTVYLAGVAAGSLGTSITDPMVKLAGASGGVYSLITAHLATIIMNWNEMSYPFIQLFILLILMGSDVGTAIYDRYVLKLDQKIGYAAHFFGALAGLLVGITVLRNIEVTRVEKYVRRISFIIYVALMAAAIICNIVYPSHFPEQTV